jgi:N-acyl-phosphatidylethanolamine-hydrolysing phospholipase D
MPLEELPQADIVILSHNHFDHTCVLPTSFLKDYIVTRFKVIQPPLSIYIPPRYPLFFPQPALIAEARDVQPKGSVHFLCALGNLKWFESIGFDKEDVTELDWWDARDATITLQTKARKSTLTITCLPCQHFSEPQSTVTYYLFINLSIPLAGRSLWDRFHTLWASWAVEQRPYDSTSDSKATSLSKPISKIWFGGDTGLRSVPRGSKQEEMPICPAFKQIGERFGGFDLAVRPSSIYK